jgi:Uncharacterised protein family (UPF0014)
MMPTATPAAPRRRAAMRLPPASARSAAALLCLAVLCCATAATRGDALGPASVDAPDAGAACRQPPRAKPPTLARMLLVRCSSRAEPRCAGSRRAIDSGSALQARLQLAGSSEYPADDGTGAISYGRLALVVLLLAVPLAVSAWMRLDLHWALAIGGARCCVQLMALGYVLQIIFELNHWWVAALYILFMLGVTTVEALSRPSKLYVVRLRV